MPTPHNSDTPTERALESELHVHASRHYALRADQLEDGTYRYALEDTRSGTVLAEGVDPDARAAVALFEQSLDRAGLQ